VTYHTAMDWSVLVVARTTSCWSRVASMPPSVDFIYRNISDMAPFVVPVHRSSVLLTGSCKYYQTVLVNH